MRILITGAAGFFGRNLIDHLTDHELVLFDNAPAVNTLAGRRQYYKNHVIHCYDVVSELPYYKKHLTDIDLVIHLANKARIPPSWKNFEQYYQTNITGSQQLFETCVEMAVNKFIYVSSSSVYGNNGTKKQKETDLLCPTNPYAVSKMAAEWALRSAAQDTATELVIVRPFTMYGDDMDFGTDALVIGKFLKAHSVGQPLVQDGGGIHRRDFVHITDAAQAMLKIIEHSKHSDIFNIGSGISVSIKELADAVSDYQISGDDRKGAVDVTEADITRLKMLLYKPRHSVLDWVKLKKENYDSTNGN